MEKIIYRADDRGTADHGWLKAKHSFSFAGYNNPAKTNFGLLRVLNDDIVAPSMGFGMHPHENMEIVTIPLKGALKHKDSMGNEGVINAGDVQIMSAGSGVVHSEFNASAKEAVNLFQVWVFPKVRDIEPRYDQKTFDAAERVNRWQLLVSPDKQDNALWINQDVWFNISKVTTGNTIAYTVKGAGNGVYLMVVEGAVEIDGEKLEKRDAIGIKNTAEITILATTDAELLLIDVPMY